MRGLLVLTLLMILIPSVLAQTPICGNNIQEEFEDCDGTDDAACPGLCQFNCLCPPLTDSALFELAIDHNLLFSKVLNLMHIVKQSIFQLEVKTVEIQLTDYDCDTQPVSFWMPSEFSPFGKLGEIDDIVVMLISSIDAAGPSSFGLTTQNLDDAQDKLNDAESCSNQGLHRDAFNCKCLAYRNDLLGMEDDTVTCSSCEVNP